ncbi:MAG TPA: cytochrome c peroxidase [Steroidobacteraceae bacterium]|nr:cytochrome c peroxidase [Steroidobacteraceae bacterium]
MIVRSNMPVIRLFVVLAFLLSAAAVADSAAPQPGVNPHPVKLRLPAVQPLSAMAQLGRLLFYDARLSGSGKLSCASCHSPTHAYGPPGKIPVVLGGSSLHQYGVRAVPSLRYLYRQPSFSIGPDASGDNDNVMSLQQQAQHAAEHVRASKTAQSPQAASANLVPQGGLFWDGRADTLQQQANGPLFNPLEMAAGTPDRVAKKLRSAAYAKNFYQLFGNNVFENPQQAVAEAMFAIARYQIEDQSFHPFTSKFDAWLQGKARFNAAEQRGYDVFNDPAKGNCAACHLDRPSRDGLPPLFTDFQYEALGVPRNAAIPANADMHYYDLGLCGPYRDDLRDQTQYCGMFLTPSLRNTAIRHVYFHNGVFHTLDKVLDWYVNRDIHPERFYPRGAQGNIIKFNDLPQQYQGNVDTQDAPFNRHPGDQPALTAAEIQDIIAFLQTLNDGYTISLHPSLRAGEGRVKGTKVN